MSTDQIQKSIILKASRARAWRAISDAAEFGLWFGVSFDGPFVPGSRITGRIVPTRVDPEVARLQEPHAGKPFEFTVESIEPGERIVFRWHPFAIDPAVDYSGEPATRIVFELRDEPGGVRLTITESGFDQIPLARRADAFRANDGGWAHQVQLLARYLAMPEGALAPAAAAR